MAFKVPNSSRVRTGPMASTINDGNNGVFEIARNNRTTFFCIASDGMGWEHVSVHARTDNQERTPTWAEMCWIKDQFWEEEDCVVQYHPPKSEYVNNHPHVLHLWRSTEAILPMPLSIMVGMKDKKPEDFKKRM